MVTNEQRMTDWCSQWALIRGVVVCLGCLRKSLLANSGNEFQHAPGCRASKEAGPFPWGELHDILDDERG